VFCDVDFLFFSGDPGATAAIVFWDVDFVTAVGLEEDCCFPRVSASSESVSISFDFDVDVVVVGLEEKCFPGVSASESVSVSFDFDVVVDLVENCCFPDGFASSLSFDFVVADEDCCFPDVSA